MAKYDHPRAVLAAVAIALPCSAAGADLVAQWNAIALDTVITSERQVSHAARAMASVHVAMFEAMCFVEGVCAPRYLVKPPTPLGASGEAVAAVAAHYVLSELYPRRRSHLDAALSGSLAALDPQELPLPASGLNPPAPGPPRRPPPGNGPGSSGATLNCPDMKITPFTPTPFAPCNSGRPT